MQKERNRGVDKKAKFLFEVLVGFVRSSSFRFLLLGDDGGGWSVLLKSATLLSLSLALPLSLDNAHTVLLASFLSSL